MTKQEVITRQIKSGYLRGGKELRKEIMNDDSKLSRNVRKLLILFVY